MPTSGPALLMLVTLGAGAARGEQPPVDFTRDVLPILADNCYRCHNADQRKSGLRLDDAAAAHLGGDSGLPAIVPGKPEESFLVRLLRGDDPDWSMMPPEGDPLTEEQILRIERWIREGAVRGDFEDAADAAPAAPDHWAFRKPQSPPLPQVALDGWPRNEIDHFILARLEREGLSPAPEADRATLIRRVSLDLTGLPPTPAEVDDFELDHRADAYERVVDRLLASPRYGERQAVPWLDLARYADTNGYEKDRPRKMWIWRDWLIGALNDNMPFDQFTIEQIAGDLLPDATRSQRIATGFHRNTMLNDEGGIDPEEFRKIAVVDRANTTAEVWLGLTMACAQCHTHKYDPVTQKEYYEFFAFFNSSRDNGRDPDPRIFLPTEEQREAIRRLKGELFLLEEWSASGDEAEKKEREKKIEAARKRITDFDQDTVLVMEALDEPRETNLLKRGDFFSPGIRVEPGVPSVLNPLSEGAEHPRLRLARWLVSRENPLTARVTVNRAWHSLFGRGIVPTLNDFGTRGDPPSHPELLDRLAVRFMDSGWDMKALHRLIVTSATYRQSSTAGATLLERDPYNVLLARGPRLRVDAEFVRDIALHAAGLLSPRIGGPSVMPPQPEGIWGNSFTVHDTKDVWTTAEGEDRYRRGMYTYLRRTAPYPTAILFDGSRREVCTSMRSRTNTPVQALVTMSDPVFVEAAGALGRRMFDYAAKSGAGIADAADADAGLIRGFRLCVARDPDGAELESMRRLYGKSLVKFGLRPDDARSLLEHARVAGEGMGTDESASLAAFVMVGNLLLNLDETITKG